MVVGDDGIKVVYLHGSFQVMFIVSMHGAEMDKATVGLPTTTRNDSGTGVASTSKV